MQWDIFCRVIDNHGDAGVCWRLSAELARRGAQVRLWIDDPTPLGWMAPQGQPGVEVIPWTAQTLFADAGDVVIEAFGCDPPPAYVERIAQRTRQAGRQPPWLNLEYLSAESYVERSHGLPSPVMQGPGAGLVKHFFYPGFTARTGGLLRERDLAADQAAFRPREWLGGQGIPDDPGRSRVSLFCYEPAALPALLLQFATARRPVLLLVTAGRARAAVRAAQAALDAGRPGWNDAGRLALHELPLLSQPDYDRLLWSCDLNFVRGEDSLARALLARRPFVWQLYPQDDGAHHAKLDAFLHWLQPAPGLARFHAIWNGAATGELPCPDWEDWVEAAGDASARAWQLPELAESLHQFVLGRGRI